MTESCVLGTHDGPARPGCGGWGTLHHPDPRCKGSRCPAVLAGPGLSGRAAFLAGHELWAGTGFALQGKGRTSSCVQAPAQYAPSSWHHWGLMSRISGELGQNQPWPVVLPSMAKGRSFEQQDKCPCSWSSQRPLGRSQAPAPSLLDAARCLRGGCANPAPCLELGQREPVLQGQGLGRTTLAHLCPRTDSEKPQGTL